MQIFEGFSGYAIVPPTLPAVETETLALPAEPEAFEELNVEGETSGSSQPIFDPEIVISAIATSPNVLARTGREPQALVQRFAVNWSVESALRDCKSSAASRHLTRQLWSASHPTTFHRKLERISLRAKL